MLWKGPLACCYSILLSSCIKKVKLNYTIYRTGKHLSSRPTLIRGYFCLHSNSREISKLRLSADVTLTAVFTPPYPSVNLYKLRFKHVWLLILFEITHLHTFF